jgi:hypothetical protein
MVTTIAELAAQMGVSTENLLIACRNLGFDVHNANDEIDTAAFQRAVQMKKKDLGTTAAEWAPDPTGRHALRYWDGVCWTAHVTDEGVPGFDPIATTSEGEAAMATPAVPAAPTTIVDELPPQAIDTPVWRRWWAIAAAVVVLLVVVGSLLPKDPKTKPTSSIAAGTHATSATVAPTPPTEPATTAAIVTETPTTVALPPTTARPVTPAPRPATPRVTAAPASASDVYAGESVSQSNARRTAASYLDYTAFSRSGLIKQLVYEGFSNADATYGTDAVHADWFEQAARMARSYMEYSSFSRQGLIDQLKYEGFSQAEAEHGADSVGL